MSQRSEKTSLKQVTWLVVTEVRSKSFWLFTERRHYNKRACYRVLLLKRTSCPKHLHYNVRPTKRCVFTVKYGIMRFLYAMCVFKVRASSSSPSYLCAKFRFFRSLHCCGSPWRKIVYSVTHPAYLLPRELNLSLWHNNWQNYVRLRLTLNKNWPHFLHSSTTKIKIQFI